MKRTTKNLLLILTTLAIALAAISVVPAFAAPPENLPLEHATTEEWMQICPRKVDSRLWDKLGKVYEGIVFLGEPTLVQKEILNYYGKGTGQFYAEKIKNPVKRVKRG